VAKEEGVKTKESKKRETERIGRENEMGK